MSDPTMAGLDMDSLKLIADSVARTAATQVSEQLEAKMSEQHEKLKRDVIEEFRRDLKGYFGSLQSDEHIVQHNRIEKLLNFIDRTSENFLGRIISQLLMWGTILLVVGYAAFGKGTPS